MQQGRSLDDNWQEYGTSTQIVSSCLDRRREASSTTTTDYDSQNPPYHSWILTQYLDDTIYEFISLPKHRYCLSIVTATIAMGQARPNDRLESCIAINSVRSFVWRPWLVETRSLPFLRSFKAGSSISVMSFVMLPRNAVSRAPGPLKRAFASSSKVVDSTRG